VPYPVEIHRGSDIIDINRSCRGVIVGDILVRNITPDIERAIKALAKESGQSVSDAAQKLLRKGLMRSSQKRGLASEIRSLIHPNDYVDLDIKRDDADRAPLDFS
jgi:plasmid stability protein